MSGQIVANFDILLYNNLRIVPKTMKRDFTPNGKLQYDWGPYSIAHNLSNITNNFDWTVPSIYNSRITNTSKFFIRVETISLSGIFGEQPPLGGTYGPFSMVLGDPSHPTASESSIASKITIKSNFISITNVNAVILWNLLFGGVLLAIALLSLNTLIL
ncbi:hypothetical protein C1645_782113 [Glomus cerebriforme]|uniref:Uncharacterized protein n=1 Tax=Glomus cerebriforme TaxID=658196 RepID=A0A397S7F3_9GLOM|nr:hypothetical protein C1645_793536 [Glomus cerebriforme]RIA85317.1 hypothetical protein C1645_782113 [Glomus cerebriforme]